MAETALVPTFRCPECNTVIAESKRLTPIQDRFADILAEDKHDTYIGAARKAGYSDTSAKGWAFVVKEDPQFQREVARRKEKKRDNARGLFSGGLEVAGTILEQIRGKPTDKLTDSDRAFALQSVKAGADVLEKGIGTEEDSLSPDATRAMMRWYRRRFMARAVRMALYLERKRARGQAEGVG